MTLPPYPKYKPSGVMWLREVPEHWNVLPLKRLCVRSALYGANIPADAYTTSGVRFIRTTDIDEFGGLRPGGVYVDEQIVRGHILNDGDLLTSRSGTIGRTLRYNADRHPVAAYAGYLVRFVPSDQVSPDYLFYVTMSQAFFAYLDAHVIASTIENVNGQRYSRCPIPVPHRSEQDEIATFLDRAIVGVDRLAETQRALIERLREKRDALITRTVIGGLPPEAAREAGFEPAPPRRASCVEWLGDIPAHWQVMRLKYVATVNDEALPDTTPANQQIQYVDIGSVDSVKGVTTSETLTFESAPSRARRIVRDGDTIVSTVRTYLRAIAAIREPVENLVVSTGFAVIRPRRMEPRYLSYAARESRFVETVVARSVGVSYPAVNASEIATIPVPMPPATEQRAISDYLDRETAKLDRLIEKVETAIERLREYRSALITAVVTGMVDVRGASRETGKAAG